MPSIKSTVGNKRHISLDDVCFLISKTYTEDELGQRIPTESERQVFCTVLSITRHEFATAGQLGLKPKLMIVLNNEEYDGENTLAYNGKKYSIYKDYVIADGYVELYSEVKVGG